MTRPAPMWTELAEQTAELLARLSPEQDAAFRADYAAWLARLDSDPDRLTVFGRLSVLDLETITRGAQGKEREAVAYHEAGHVVAALVAGIRVSSATIRPEADTTSIGHIRHEPMPPDARPDLVLANMALNMAGPIAEDLGGYPYKQCTYQQHVDETLRDGQLAQPYGGTDELLALLKAAECRARGLLSHYWPAVVAVATALLTHETLDEPTLRALVRGAVLLKLEGEAA